MCGVNKPKYLLEILRDDAAFRSASMELDYRVAFKIYWNKLKTQELWLKYRFGLEVLFVTRSRTQRPLFKAMLHEFVFELESPEILLLTSVFNSAIFGLTILCGALPRFHPSVPFSLVLDLSLSCTHTLSPILHIFRHPKKLFWYIPSTRLLTQESSWDNRGKSYIESHFLKAPVLGQLFFLARPGLGKHGALASPGFHWQEKIATTFNVLNEKYGVSGTKLCDDKTIYLGRSWKLGQQLIQKKTM